MVVPDGVVEHELVVAVAPVVADAGVFVDDEGVDVEGFEAGGCCEAGLASSWGCVLVRCISDGERVGETYRRRGLLVRWR